MPSSVSKPDLSIERWFVGVWQINSWKGMRDQHTATTREHNLSKPLSPHFALLKCFSFTKKERSIVGVYLCFLSNSAVAATAAITTTAAIPK
jgi:hypothetical protein